MIANVNQANILKVAAVAIAAPRYIGAFGAAIGLPALEAFSWLASTEMLSGAAMAILEGFAITFVLSRWRVTQPRSIHWYVLTGFVAVLAGTVPFVSAPYLLMEQTGLSVAEVFGGSYALQAAWSLLIAGVPMLIIMAVGFADVGHNSPAKPAKVPVSTAAKPQPVEVSQPSAKPAKPSAKSQLFVCECGKSFATHRGLNGHRAHCTAEPAGHSTNGHGGVRSNGVG